jgi:hypothetical protein
MTSVNIASIEDTTTPANALDKLCGGLCAIRSLAYAQTCVIDNLEVGADNDALSHLANMIYDLAGEIEAARSAIWKELLKLDRTAA